MRSWAATKLLFTATVSLVPSCRISSRQRRTAIQFDGVAVRVFHIHRRTIAISTIPCHCGRLFHAVLLQVRAQRVRIKIATHKQW